MRTAEPAAGSLIRISPDTVFTVREIERDGEKRSVLSTTIGTVRFKFDRLTGKEPLIATPGTVAGIRGTELEVYAGSDGAVMILVSTGAVVVESLGKSVSLAENEGVEIAPGEPPGDVFEVLRGQLDFSTWNGERDAAILKNPLKALTGAIVGLASLIADLESVVPQFEAKLAELETLRAEEDDDKQKSIYEQTVFPLEVATSYLALNLRYYALSALSFRRYVLGTMYLRVKMRAIVEQSDEHQRFFEEYDRVMEDFEDHVTPHLVGIDI